LKRESQTFPRWAVVLLTALNLGLFFIPALIIRPFKFQSASGLTLAIYIKQFAPLLALVAATGVVFLVFQLWREARVLLRVGLVLAVVLSAASAVMVRLNYFEWKFNPIQTAGFTSASEIQLPDAEMVMTVRISQDARAYPIRQMAYHHVLNDTVGSTPIVVTY
jgi:hypothetical protein